MIAYIMQLAIKNLKVIKLVFDIDQNLGTENFLAKGK